MKYIFKITIIFLFLNIGVKAENVIRVGISNAPPFIMKENPGYTGVSIDLWEAIADSLNVDFIYKEYPISEITNALLTNKIDLIISPLTVTSNRIKKFSFSQPYYITSLAYAVRAKDDNFLHSFLIDFFSWTFFKALISLFSIIFVFGIIAWLVENKRNRKQFRKGHKGLGDGIWWSAVTMATVGYGDKSPKTFAGRAIAIVWMFTAVIVISSLTASISSSLTVHKLKTEINTIDDLRKVKVGTVTNSGSSQFLDGYRIFHHDFFSVHKGLDALNSKKIDAFVFDDAVLSYYVEQSDHKDEVKIIPSAYFKEYFSIGSTNSQLIDSINTYLLSVVESQQWKKELKKYNIEYRN